MNHIKGFLIIITISFIGEILKIMLPLPVPASIYGMLILIFGLLTGIIPLEKVKKVGDFFIEIMPLMFIPAGVGLMSSWGVLRPMLLPVSVITVVSIITVMAVSGHVAQFIIRYRGKVKNKNKGERDDE